jgi:hypothetical protein
MRPLLHLFPAVAAATLMLITNVLATAPAFAESEQSDQFVAAHVLGPNWRQLCRHAGMIFAGTVLASPSELPRTDRGVPYVEVSLRVDRAIAGVKLGQVLTIQEWTGALSSHPTMRPGEHLLLFLYPPSRLSLTSPVGGAQGQIRLDSLGTTVVDREARTLSTSPPSRLDSSDAMSQTSFRHVTVMQLERAVRDARGE